MSYTIYQLCILSLHYILYTPIYYVSGYGTLSKYFNLGTNIQL